MKELRLYDNTMLSDFKRCPRFFFYRHELGWKSKGPSPALAFGSAWHEAMEVVWASFAALKGTDFQAHSPTVRAEKKKEIVQEAFGAWSASWVKEGMPDPASWSYELEQQLSPRTPGRALEMLLAYIEQRARIINEFEILSIEKPFAVPMTPDDDTLFYIGKIDKIARRRQNAKIVGFEHKTTTAYRKGGPFRGGFLDSFSPNSQIDGYSFALHLLFPGEVGGIWVDAALVHKEEEGFVFIPIERRLDHLDSWLWEARWWINKVEEERKELNATAEISSKVMRAFPKNTNSCWDFNQACQFLELCKSWTNPLGKDVPLTHEVNFWSPLNHVKGLTDPRTQALKTRKLSIG